MNTKDKIIKIRENKIKELEEELKELIEKTREKEKRIHDEYVALIKVKYELTEERMNSRFTFKEGFYRNAIFNKLEFLNGDTQYLSGNKVNKDGSISKKSVYIYKMWLEDIIWLDEINNDKEN